MTRRNDKCPCGSTNKELDIIKLHTLYEGGQTLEQLGELVGVHGRTVGRWFTKHGLPIRNKSECVMGELNPSFKNNPTISKDGYVMIWRNGMRMLEHRAVIEEHLNRPLLSSELVHHINGIKTDNRVENLMLVNGSNHRKEHVLPHDIWSCHYERCVRCGTTDRKHAGHGLCTTCSQYLFTVQKRGYECEYQNGVRIFSDEHIERLRNAALLRETRKKYKKCCMTDFTKGGKAKILKTAGNQ